MIYGNSLSSLSLVSSLSGGISLLSPAHGKWRSRPGQPAQAARPMSPVKVDIHTGQNLGKSSSMRAIICHKKFLLGVGSRDGAQHRAWYVLRKIIIMHLCTLLYYTCRVHKRIIIITPRACARG